MKQTNLYRFTNSQWQGKKQNSKYNKSRQVLNKKNQDAYKKESAARNRRYKELSFKPDQDWPQIEELTKYTIENFPKFAPGAPTVVKRAGRVGHYKLNIDSVMSKNPLKFTSFENVDIKRLSSIGISKDKHILSIPEENKINGTIIYATDSVLSSIMTFGKSVYSFDFIVRKSGSNIFFDRRESGKLSSLDFENVGENCSQPPPVTCEDPNKKNKSKKTLEINTAIPLMEEGTKILHSVQTIAIDTSKILDLDVPHPLQETDNQQDLPTQGMCQFVFLS